MYGITVSFAVVRFFILLTNGICLKEDLSRYCSCDTVSLTLSCLIQVNIFKTSDLMVNNCTISVLIGHPRPSTDWLLDGCPDQIEIFSCFLSMAEVDCCDKQTHKMITTAYFK